MKVIKNGRDKVFVMTCPSCHTDFQFKKKDVASSTIRLGGYLTRAVETIICPECNHSTQPNYNNEVAEE